MDKSKKLIIVIILLVVIIGGVSFMLFIKQKRIRNERTLRCGKLEMETNIPLSPPNMMNFRYR